MLDLPHPCWHPHSPGLQLQTPSLPLHPQKVFPCALAWLGSELGQEAHSQVEPQVHFCAQELVVSERISKSGTSVICWVCFRIIEVDRGLATHQVPEALLTSVQAQAMVVMV